MELYLPMWQVLWSRTAPPDAARKQLQTPRKPQLRANNKRGYHERAGHTGQSDYLQMILGIYATLGVAALLIVAAALAFLMPRSEGAASEVSTV